MTKENSINSTGYEENVEVIHELNLEVPKGRYCSIAALKTEMNVHYICVDKSYSSQAKQNCDSIRYRRPTRQYTGCLCSRCFVKTVESIVGLLRGQQFWFYDIITDYLVEKCVFVTLSLFQSFSSTNLVTNYFDNNDVVRKHTVLAHSIFLCRKLKHTTDDEKSLQKKQDYGQTP